MSITSQVKKAALAAGAVTLVTGAAIAGTQAAASAAVAHTFKICAWGDYHVFAASTQQKGEVLVAPGHCGSFSLDRSTTYVKVTAQYGPSPLDTFYVGAARFKASKGWSGAAEGTISHHWLRDFG
jgi:hypothetical protein